MGPENAGIASRGRGMSLGPYIRHLARLRHRNLILVGVLATLSVVSPFFVYMLSRHYSDRMAEFAEHVEAEDRAQQKAKIAQEFQERLTSPASGTTPEKIAALSIGMTGKEVQRILDHPYSLGVEMFPYLHRVDDHYWVVNDIPIKDVGYVQAVFIDEKLVGLGSLDPAVGRLCAGCLMDMLSGDRGWLAGLPFQVQGHCPVCGSNEVVPFGATLDSLQKSLSRAQAEVDM